jgi:hypothetical protein
MTTPDDVTRSRQAAVDRRLREREELAEVVQQAINDHWVAPAEIADAILAAGWRKS